MERGPEENGAAKPLEEVASEQYSQPVDRQQLINEGSEVSPLQMEQEKESSKCVGEGLKVIIVSSISFSIAVTVALIVSIYFGPPQVPPHGGVACDDPKCSAIGKDILQTGGSSVDVAIAVTLCMGVVQPQNSGIGGGGVMVIHHTQKPNQEHITEVLDFLEVAPSNASKKGFDPTQAKMGGQAVAVPGQVAGLEAAHKLYGKLKWKDLVMPAVHLARSGFNISKELVEEMKTAALSDLITTKGGNLKEGDVVTRPAYAVLLEKIAHGGAKAFYEGEVAKQLAGEIQSAGGVLSAKDLQNYEVKKRSPATATVLETTLASAPSPAGGSIALSVINIIEALGVAAVNRTDPAFYQRLVEAMKFGYAQQTLLGDPEFNSDMANVSRTMLSEDMAATLAGKIEDSSLNDQSQYFSLVGSTATSAVQSDIGGTHISVIGPDDFLVSTSSSLNSKFGSGLLTSSGVLLNNQMAAFSVNSPNDMAPGKRPISPLSPTVVFSQLHPCSARVAVGGSQGSHLIAGVAQVILNIMGFQQDITKAVQEPRMFSTPDSNDVVYEDNMGKNIQDKLQTAGYNLKTVTQPGTIGFINIVYKINETVNAYSDDRSDGGALFF